MKEFIKNNFKKFICAFAIVCILSMSVISAFAYFPSTGVSFSYNDLVSKYYANEYYYRYIMEIYNWNTNTVDGRVPMTGNFNQYYKFAWFPFRSYYGSNLKTDMESVLIQLAQTIKFDQFTNILDYVRDYEIIAYYDIQTNSTKIVYIPIDADSINYYIYNVNFVTYTANGSGHELDGSTKKFCTLNGSGLTIGGVSKSPDAYVFVINSNASAFSYTKTDLSGTDILFAPQNVLFCTSGIRQSILNKYNNDSSIFKNYYNTNGLNSIQFIDFNNITFSDITTGYPYGDYMLANIVKYEDHDFVVSLNFDVYFFGNTNIDFNRYFVSMDFLRNIYGSRTVNLNTYTASWTAYNFKIINRSIYKNSANDADLNKYTIQVQLSTSATNINDLSYLSGYNDFDIVYFESLDWSTSISNNRTAFGYDLSSSNVNNDLNILWNNLQGGIDFITYITQRLYIIMPSQVYTFLVASLAIVVILGTKRLIIS